MHRVVAFIDGLNLYHAVRSLEDSRLEWCDVVSLSRLFLRRNERLKTVHYYNAYPHHLSQLRRQRYKRYTKSVCASGARLVEGRFKRKGCTHEEKETDVNIALDMLDLAYRGEFDKCFLVSGDSDLKPAVGRVLANFPRKSVTILAPPGQHVNDFRNLRHAHRGRLEVMQIKRSHLRESVLHVELPPLPVLA